MKTPVSSLTRLKVLRNEPRYIVRKQTNQQDDNKQTRQLPNTAENSRVYIISNSNGNLIYCQQHQLRQLPEKLDENSY